MPRRRQTRAEPPATTKNINPKLKNLLRDFDIEVETMLTQIDGDIQSSLTSVKQLYDVEINRLPARVLSLKWDDYRKDQCVDKTALTPVMNQVIDSLKCGPTASKKKGRQTKAKSKIKRVVPKIDVEEEKDTVTDLEYISTAMKNRSQRVDRLHAGKSVSFLEQSQENFFRPPITPKFDPRHVSTPASVLRRPKPGEVIMSMRGSPLANSISRDTAFAKGVTINLDDGKVMTLPADSYVFEDVIPELDPKTLQSVKNVHKTLEKIINKNNIA